MKFSLFSPNVRAVNSFLAQKSQKRRFNVNLSLSIAVMHLAVQAISLASLKFERKKTNISNKRNIVIKNPNWKEVEQLAIYGARILASPPEVCASLQFINLI